MKQKLIDLILWFIPIYIITLIDISVHADEYIKFQVKEVPCIKCKRKDRLGYCYNIICKKVEEYKKHETKTD